MYIKFLKDPTAMAGGRDKLRHGQPFCKAILKGLLNEYKTQFNNFAFNVEEIQEDQDNNPIITLDEIYGEEDLGASLPEGAEAREADLQRQENFDAQERERCRSRS